MVLNLFCISLQLFLSISFSYNLSSVAFQQNVALNFLSATRTVHLLTQPFYLFRIKSYALNAKTQKRYKNTYPILSFFLRNKKKLYKQENTSLLMRIIYFFFPHF